MNINKYIAAVGGVAVGVGSTLLALKLRKESGADDSITMTEAIAYNTSDATEPKNVTEYREAVKQNPTAAKTLANAPVKKTTTTKLSASSPTEE